MILKNIFMSTKIRMQYPMLLHIIKRHGILLSQNQLRSLKNNKYKVVIDSSYKNGVMDYGETYIKGKSKKKFFSTYLCHLLWLIMSYQDQL